MVDIAFHKYFSSLINVLRIFLLNYLLFLLWLFVCIYIFLTKEKCQ